MLRVWTCPRPESTPVEMDLLGILAWAVVAG